MEISEKVGEISVFIGKNRKKSEIFGKNRTNEISVHFSFRGSPKNDISAKYRPKKPKFLSMGITDEGLAIHTYGNLRYRGPMVVPLLVELRDEILREFHCSRFCSASR